MIQSSIYGMQRFSAVPYFKFKDVVMKYLGCLLIFMSIACAGSAFGAIPDCGKCKESAKIIFEMSADYGCANACSSLAPYETLEICSQRCSELQGLCTGPDCCAKDDKEGCILKYCRDIKSCPK